MAKLTGQTIANSYDQLLIVDHADGISATLQSIESGDTGGSASSLKISTSKVEVIPASDSTSLFEVSQADGTAVLSVDTTNARVGIGTAAPDALLHLESNVTGISDAHIRLTDNADAREASIVCVAGDLVLATHGTDNAADGQITIHEGGAIYFSTGSDGAADVTIDTAGDVGIGVSPSAPIDIKSSQTDTNVFEIEKSGSAGAMARFYEGASGEGMFSLYDDTPTEDVRISTYGDSWFNGGNVGIGTDSPNTLLEVEGTWDQTVITGLNDNVDNGINLINLGTGYQMNDYFGYYFSTATGSGHSYPFGAILGKATSASNYLAGDIIIAGRDDASDADLHEYLVVKPGGNVGIGTAAPSATLTIAGQAASVGAAANALLRVGTLGTDENYHVIGFGYQAGTYMPAYIGFQTKSGGSYTSGDLIFGVRDDDTDKAATEAMRINSAGKVLFGTTTVTGLDRGDGIISGGASFSPNSVGRTILQLGSVNYTSAADIARFYNQNGEVGSISTDGSATAFNTSSDYRLKENEVPISDGIERLNQLKPYRFNFKTDADKTVDGFFAHEVSDIVPEAIYGEKDAMRDEEVSPAIQAVEAVEGQEEIAWTDKPTEENTKDEIKAWMDSNSLAYNSGDTKADLIAKIPELQQEFIQSVEAVEAVDAVYESVPKYQGIDQSKLVPLLVAAIQELSAKVEALENA